MFEIELLILRDTGYESFHILSCLSMWGLLSGFKAPGTHTPCMLSCFLVVTCWRWFAVCRVYQLDVCTTISLVFSGLYIFPERCGGKAVRGTLRRGNRINWSSRSSCLRFGYKTVERRAMTTYFHDIFSISASLYPRSFDQNDGQVGSRRIRETC